MKTTIGGDRIGSGSKQEVSMKTYNRSTHDLSYTWRSSMAPGTLVPFMSELALPGDSWDIDLNCDVLTLPTIGPLFGSFKVQLDVFQVPIRLYNARLHMNELGIGMEMDNVKLPQVQLLYNWDTDNKSTEYHVFTPQTHPSSLLNYLGIKGVGKPTTKTYNGLIERYFNAVPFLGYYEIFKAYYANKQEDRAYAISPTLGDSIDTKAAVCYGALGFGIPVDCYDNAVASAFETVFELVIFFSPSADEPNYNNIDIVVDGIEGPLTDYFNSFEYIPEKGELHCTDPENSNSGTLNVQPQSVPIGNPTDLNRVSIRSFILKNIDDMRKQILRWDQDDVPFKIGTGSLAPYAWHRNSLPGVDGWNPRIAMFNQNGLCLKTYQSDLFNNWISTEWIDGANGVNEITRVDTSEGSFTIDALNLAQKVYVMLNRIAISGGTFDDWLDAVYTHERRKGIENPVYHGSLIKELAFQEVVSNAETSTSTDKPLGTLAGRGKLTSKNKGGKVKIKVDEPSYLMGIVSITPRVDYSQGNKWDMNLESINDFHKPQLDAIGFEDLVTDQMSYMETVVDETTGEISYLSAGKVPAWINYMTSYNKTFGNFALRNKEMFMTLNRRYALSYEGGIGDLTTYIDPEKFNFVFAQTDISAQNFWVQIAVDAFARRKMSAKVIPNL